MHSIYKGEPKHGKGQAQCSGGVHTSSTSWIRTSHICHIYSLWSEDSQLASYIEQFVVTQDAYQSMLFTAHFIQHQLLARVIVHREVPGRPRHHQQRITNRYIHLGRTSLCVRHSRAAQWVLRMHEDSWRNRRSSDTSMHSLTTDTASCLANTCSCTPRKQSSAAQEGREESIVRSQMRSSTSDTT